MDTPTHDVTEAVTEAVQLPHADVAEAVREATAQLQSDRDRRTELADRLFVLLVSRLPDSELSLVCNDASHAWVFVRGAYGLADYMLVGDSQRNEPTREEGV